MSLHVLLHPRPRRYCGHDEDGSFESDCDRDGGGDFDANVDIATDDGCACPSVFPSDWG